MKKITLALIMSLLLFGVAAADSISLSFNQYGTDNLFQSRFKEADQISTLSFSLEKNFNKVSLFTYGDYSYLFQNTDLSRYRQEVGLDYMQLLSEKSALYFSITGEGSFYREDFTDFNSFSFTLFSSYKSYLTPTSILQASYSLMYRDYNLSGFDYSSHSLTVTVDKYFQTKTTLKAEINWGYKTFIHPYPSVAAAPAIPTSSPTMQSNGKGHGGQGNPMMKQPSQYFSETEDGGSQSVQVFSLGGLVAQGIGNKIGIRFSGMKQWYLSGENPFSTIEEYYMIENPSYDHFSWKGYQLEGLLTVLVPWDIQLKIGYTYSRKAFPGVDSLDIEGESLGITREDRRNQLQARLEKNFPRFTLFVSYYYLDNRSSDSYFEWKGNFISAGIEWNLLFGDK